MAKLARIENDLVESGADRAEELAAKTEDAVARGAEAAQDTAEQVTEGAREVAGRAAKTARDATDRATETVRAGARSGLAAVESAADRQREVAQSATRDLAGFASAFASLLNEQAQENLRLATALGTTTDWQRLARIQWEFVEGSFTRLQQASEHYRAAVQHGLFNSTATSSRF